MFEVFVLYISRTNRQYFNSLITVESYERTRTEADIGVARLLMSSMSAIFIVVLLWKPEVSSGRSKEPEVPEDGPISIPNPNRGWGGWVGWTAEPASKLDNNVRPKPTSTSAFLIGSNAAPTNPDIWKELAVGVLRVAPISPAASGCEGLAPAAISSAKWRLSTLTGTSWQSLQSPG